MSIAKKLTIIGFGFTALVAAALSGCGGSSSSPPPPPPPPPTVDLSSYVAQAKPEQCSYCHEGDAAIANSGANHMNEYKKYADKSKFTLAFSSLSTTPNQDGTYTLALTFKAFNDGVPFTAAQLAALAQKRFYTVKYDSSTRQYTDSTAFASNSAYNNPATYVPTANPGEFTITTTTADFSPLSVSGAQVYGYIADGTLDTEGMTLYDNVANAGWTFGDASTYQSAANVSACETCHGKPYMKHGYRMAHVDNGITSLPDFAGCKDCHVNGVAGHDDLWQIMKDDPTRAAEIANGSAETQAEQDKYAYQRILMNDVHMSHNMEFPYPQSMQNCATCHAGNMGLGPVYTPNGALPVPQAPNNDIFADDKFKASTCVSCHSVDGLMAKMQGSSSDHVITIHDNFINTIASAADRDTVDCTICHGTLGGSKTPAGPSFAQIHNNGYNTIIYATSGLNTATRYSDVITASIDSATYDAASHTLDIKFSASGDYNGKYDGNGDTYDFNSTNISPTVMIGLYGYDTKDFIVAAHANNADGKKNLEHAWGDGNPRFTDVSGANGQWEVKVDLSDWADKLDADANGLVVIRRAEIAVMPALGHPTVTTIPYGSTTPVPAPVALNAPSRTFDFAADGFTDGYYPNIVNVAKTENKDPEFAWNAVSDTGNTGSLDGCNTCHDALATTFHDARRGGNIRVCRICHEVSNGAHSFQGQSRSIDSFVHAIHSFQPIGGVTPEDFDPNNLLASYQYEEEISHHFPRFTIKDCEACHVDSTHSVWVAGRRAYDVPEQTRSMPGVLSDIVSVGNQVVGDVQPAVTGPAVRACGACHRAQAINEDNQNDLQIMISHWQTFGYYIEIASDNVTQLWQEVVAKMMELFKTGV